MGLPRKYFPVNNPRVRQGLSAETDRARTEKILTGRGT